MLILAPTWYGKMCESAFCQTWILPYYPTPLPLGTEIQWIKGEKDSIRLLKVNTHDRHLILRNETHTTGFHPLTGENEKITNNILPSEADIARLICVHPESKCLNVPLSICCLIHHADKIGASDQNLLQMLLMFLKKHQPQTYFAVNPKKSTLRSLMGSLQLYVHVKNRSHK